MVMISKLLSSPKFMLLFAAGISVVSLASALTAQFAFDMAPCIMCIYQRIPFIIITVLSLIGIAAPRLSIVALGLNALTFAVNSGLAVFHTGIEQRWWDETEGCSVDFDFATRKHDLLSQVMTSQASSCAEIPWQDPLLGLSMANYNIVLCAGMAIICTIAVFMRREVQPSS